MDTLIKASESFDQADFDEKTFVKFMHQEQYGTIMVYARTSMLPCLNQIRELRFINIILI